MYSSFILKVPHLKVVVAKLCTQCWLHWKKSKSHVELSLELISQERELNYDYY